MYGVKWKGSLKILKFMEVSASRHRRSKSDPPKNVVEESKYNDFREASQYLKLGARQMRGTTQPEGRKISDSEAEISLKQEILHLQKRLQEQFALRHALEKALSFRSYPNDTADEASMPRVSIFLFFLLSKPAKDLIREVAVLEMEVVYLEQFLLSLYRKRFDHSVTSSSRVDGRLKPTVMFHNDTIQEDSANGLASEEEKSAIQLSHLHLHQDLLDGLTKECRENWGPEKLLDAGIYRSHSALSHCSAHLNGTAGAGLQKTAQSCHRQPWSILEHAHGASLNVISLGEHLGTCIPDHIPETPNWLSEEMVKSISAIFCKLADPPLASQVFPCSPTTLASSTSGFSPTSQYDMWSPLYGKFLSLSCQLDSALYNEQSKEFSEQFSIGGEVKWICGDSHKLKENELLLQKFKSLIARLEEVDPRKLNHEEKLAFWINVHNALVMHAFLVYGVPQNNIRRMMLVLKAAYNIGGQIISVVLIQNHILRCRMPRPGQWLWAVLSSKTKLKSGDERKAYAIDHNQPLLHFALCSGSHSDPMVHVYTSKSVYEEMEVAKEEYIRTRIRISKKHKFMLPKLLESYAKHSDLCTDGLIEIIEHFMPTSYKKRLQSNHKRKFSKAIQWIPHNFTFRYLLSKDLSGETTHQKPENDGI
ncbi:Ternary complex factor MIP1, leucine-zipper [Dillenia turbinata]|uniref:Ternary complex factor MIP1, leucine-zipper n=1 Tax=Dillenia turbinata TaxID=194707 RepID=A0AAN8ZTE9_9MAGN